MYQQTLTIKQEKDYSPLPLDAQLVQQIFNKANILGTIISNLITRMGMTNFGPYIKPMIDSTARMMQTVFQNLEYLNNTEIFKEDFNKTINNINLSYELFIKATNYITNFPQKQNLVNFIQINIENFARSIILFSSIFDEIMSQIGNEEDSELLKTRLGLESSLFNFAVKVEPLNEPPYFKSRFVQIYNCYSGINNISDNLVAIKSVCGTGKTLCLPLILLCKCLKEKMNVPFLIIIQPSPKHVEYKEIFFNQTISKYVTVLHDPIKLQEMYNEYWKTKQISKMVLAVLTNPDLLTIMYNLRKNPHFYPRTRIIIDEIHQRQFHLDVLISKVALFDEKLKLFNKPLSVILMSATISQSLLNPFKGKIKLITLIEKTQFPIIERRPIIESNITKINNELMSNQTVLAIKEMAKFNSTIEEGHILCFLSGIGFCHKLKNAVTNILKHTEETRYQRKIVILQTSLRSNESTESYFRRLREEFLLNEGLREGKNYKNEFLYFVPLVLSGLVEDSIYELSQNEFPGDLKKINKLICSTPMIESSFTIDRLSVVVDSGLFKETEFDRKTCLTTLTEKQTSRESMEQRKGRLGRTMKGLYISIHAPDSQVPSIITPPVQRLDLTTNVLLMKDICINFEAMDNLPTQPDPDNLNYAINTLKYIGAIDKKTLKITPFGHEMLNYPFISIYYAAAILKFREFFFGEDRLCAQFIGGYISLLVTMDTLLVQEDMTEKMSRFFKEDSDITTLANPLNQLLRSNITDNDELRDLVESYGFSYSQFLIFKTRMQEIAELSFPGKTVASVIGYIGGFVKRYGGITGLVDIFIRFIEEVYPRWEQIHSIKFKHVVGVGSFDSRPTIVFNGNDNLNFIGQRQTGAEVRISKRPGWNGITIPTECYCFNITRNSNSKLNFGRLIHRKTKNFGIAIQSIECVKDALNPWFDVLLDTYFRNSNIEVNRFTNVVVNNYISNNRTNVESKMFHYSNAGERVFVSFIPRLAQVKDKIIEGINNCLKLLPFTPRSVLIYKSDIHSVVEVTSIGAQHYESTVSSDINSIVLDRPSIDYMLRHLDLLALSNSNIRICALFINETCKANELDQNNLYYINTDHFYYKSRPLKEIANNRAKQMSTMYDQQKRYYRYEPLNELCLFQFPSKFIHPSLFYHQQTLDIIMRWFKNYCPQIYIAKVIGHRLLMRQGQILNLQAQIRNNKEKIKNEMQLNFTVVPVPTHIYAQIHTIIRQHPTWEYDNRFKVIIVANDESQTVIDLVNQKRTEIEFAKGQKSNELSESTLCCLYICDDPDNPTLTNYPITIYFKDGTRYTNRMCRDCIAESLQVSCESYFIDGKVDQNALEKISIKPPPIPSVESQETNGGLECWPQIPLGQMISALINNDDELSALVSAWLQGVFEFTIRNLAIDKFTFCPDHPHRLFDKQRLDQGQIIKCTFHGCQNQGCIFCLGWHLSSFICEEKKNGEKFEWKTKCPKCGVPTFKDGGCNHITCKCGCHWCYKCGEGFKTATECYNHLYRVHGGCFDYNFDD